jgi:hypothetical protein
MALGPMPGPTQAICKHAIGVSPAELLLLLDGARVTLCSSLKGEAGFFPLGRCVLRPYEEASSQSVCVAGIHCLDRGFIDLFHPVENLVALGLRAHAGQGEAAGSQRVG